MSAGPLALLAAGALLALALAGCSSSFDQNAALAAKSKSVGVQKGLSVGPENPDVKVTATATLTDENGTAVVVTLKSTKDEVQAPIAIDVTGADGASVFKNNAPGIEPSLTTVPVLEAGQEVDWVNDQVQPSGDAQKTAAVVGRPTTPEPAALPKLTVSDVKLTDDPSSGVLAVGTVTNDSKVAQNGLTGYGVVRRGTKVVAAGRAGLKLLKPGGKATFRMFFIGDPRKGKLAVTFPPSTVA